VVNSTTHPRASFRDNPREQERIRDLLSLVPERGTNLLDVGARDGYLSRKLADRFDAVVALDLEKPDIEHEKILPVRGDVTALSYPDGAFEIVLCAEVLEHIPPRSLVRACSELARVTSSYVIVGVPYKQDLRVGRTTCQACGKTNPPWGHVNAFDVVQLQTLFSDLVTEKISFVGQNNQKTNFVSRLLMDIAGNPYGTYVQQEPCMHCGAALQPPPDRGVFQKVLTKCAFLIGRLQLRSTDANPNWVHVRFRKKGV